MKKKRVVINPAMHNGNSENDQYKPSTAPDNTFETLLRTFKTQAIIIAIIAILFYCNTIGNSWAFDDLLVIVKNEYVQQGFAGIPKILSSDAFESAGNSQNSDGNQLTGGRYRPLSIVTFAVEQQFLGSTNSEEQSVTTDARSKADAIAHLDTAMHVRHTINLVLYAISAVLLLYFFRKVIFPSNEIAAFLSALIFTIHPLHTEVVANVKSRDELLSLLFVCLTFITAFRYAEDGRKKHLFISMGSLLLALLSKEYAIVMLALLPLSFYLFKGHGAVKSMKLTLPWLVPVTIYILMRIAALRGSQETSDADVMNNCYLLATQTEKIATIIYVPLNYLRLLLFPHPLAADYNFNQIPYAHFSDYRVWLSFVVHACLLAAMAIAIIRRHVLGFAIALYFIFLLPVSNIFINIGAPMGERLIYHASVGFAIASGYLLYIAYEKAKQSLLAKAAFGTLITLLVALAGIKTISRNADWKSDDTLFTTDVNTVPNSVIANNNAGYHYIKRAAGKQGSEQTKLLQQAVIYLDRAISINKRFTMAYLNRGVSYLRLGDMDKAAADCDTVIKYYPALPDLKVLSGPLSTHYTQIGIRFANENNDAMAIRFFRKAVSVAPFDTRIKCNLAIQLVKAKQYDEARPVLTQILHQTPDDEQAIGLLKMVEGAK